MTLKNRIKLAVCAAIATAGSGAFIAWASGYDFTTTREQKTSE